MNSNTWDGRVPSPRNNFVALVWRDQPEIYGLPPEHHCVNETETSISTFFLRISIRPNDSTELRCPFVFKGLVHEQVGVESGMCQVGCVMEMENATSYSTLAFQPLKNTGFL